MKHTGDGIMASFDTADQAVRAAVEIRARIGEVPVPEFDASLSIRIGMSSGEPLKEGEDLFGSVVNLASRLCDLADESEILVSGDRENELTDETISLSSIDRLPTVRSRGGKITGQILQATSAAAKYGSAPSPASKW